MMQGRRPLRQVLPCTGRLPKPCAARHDWSGIPDAGGKGGL